MKDLISIIVPVYNVKDYVEECVTSLMKQSYQNIEIIIVNDGSTDGSDCICEKLAEGNDKIHIIYQENKGVARARKKGAGFAKGKYLCFVDSDDYIEHDYIYNMMQQMNDYDMVTAGYYWGYGTKNKYYGAMPFDTYITENDMAYIRENMIMYEQTSERGLTPYIWDKLFRTDIANRVFEEIDENIFFGEDTEFLYRYVLRSESVCVSDVCGYHYRIREESAIRSKNEYYLKNCSDLYLSLKNAFEKHPQREQLMLKLQKWISTMIVSATRTMGFDVSAQSLEYIFPFQNELKDKNVVLYGAGNVGQNYYRQINYYEECKLILWVDKNYEKYREQGICAVEEMKKQIFDFIIIAVEREGVAREIENDLVQLGIQREKILWKKPKSTVI